MLTSSSVFTTGSCLPLQIPRRNQRLVRRNRRMLGLRSNQPLRKHQTALTNGFTIRWRYPRELTANNADLLRQFAFSSRLVSKCCSFSFWYVRSHFFGQLCTFFEDHDSTPENVFLSLSMSG